MNIQWSIWLCLNSVKLSLYFIKRHLRKYDSHLFLGTNNIWLTWETSGYIMWSWPSGLWQSNHVIIWNANTSEWSFYVAQLFSYLQLPFCKHLSFWHIFTVQKPKLTLNSNRQCLSFCAWPFLFNRMSLTFSYFTAKDGIYFTLFNYVVRPLNFYQVSWK